MDVGDLATLVAYAAFAVVSVVLALIDLRVHRLPHAIVLPSYPVAWLLLGAASVARGDGGAFLRALGGMLALFAFYLALRLAQPGGLGGGDVTLAGLIGLLLAYLGWDPLLIGAVAGFLVGGMFSLVVLATRRGDRRTRIPFGPWMLLGAWIGIASHALPT
ncbi:A24 family peptidase [Microbacterium sp. SORGH_AS_0888]|uniref:prepilin peptidase n=1 Tax=Microbacterium sp. SORGH_AS_0888 TaxID=3041791 RepID=UPI00278B911E|nr:A24 family peptidase [Microbacterium sp. SORGH_AS_0888]MDQ1128913.1 leader peptidase (prepilin peptidase)/N-methyltransferase [Microbacterium sp. SORGH_AS_0888]